MFIKGMKVRAVAVVGTNLIKGEIYTVDYYSQFEDEVYLVEFPNSYFHAYRFVSAEE